MRTTSMTARVYLAAPILPSAGAGTLLRSKNSSGAGARSSGRPLRSQCLDLGHDAARIPEHVGGREPQRRVARVDEAVLSAVVFGHALLVGPTVVFDDQTRVS